MFIPVNKELVINGEFNGNNVTDIYGFDITTINEDTKAIISTVNKGGIVYVTHFNFEEAVSGCVTLNNMIHSLKLAQSNPIKARTLKVVTSVNDYEHKRLNILSVKIKPLVVKGSTFTTHNGTYVISAITNVRVTDNLVLPFYEVTNTDDGTITNNVSQDYILKFTGIQMVDDNRSVATVVVGSEDFQARFSVSFNHGYDMMYCSSPSTKIGDDIIKFMKIKDDFGVDCLDFVESAIVRLVIGLSAGKTANYLKDKFLFKNDKKANRNSSCHNCKGCRRLTLSDTHLGDGNDTVLGSRPTGDLVKTGQYEKTLVCGYTMKPIGEERIDELNIESIHGDNKSGHLSAISELYKDIALGCDKFQSVDSKYINNNAHNCYADHDTVIVETAGIQLYFYKGKPVNK